MLTQTPPYWDRIELVQGESLCCDVLVTEKIDNPDIPVDTSDLESASMAIREHPCGEVLCLLEGLPSIPTYRASIEVDTTLPMFNQTGIFTIGNVSIGLFYVGGSGQPLNEDNVLFWDNLSGYKAMFRALAEVINTGDTTEPGFEYSGFPIDRLSATITTPDIGDSASIEVVSTDASIATVGSSFDFKDTGNQTQRTDFTLGESLENPSSITPASGHNNIKICWTSEDTDKILKGSNRPTGRVHLIGDLRLTMNNGDVHGHRLDFRFTQTT